MSVARCLDIARRWSWLVILGTVLAAGTGWLAGRRATPIYESTARLIVNQVDIPGVSSYQDPLTTDRRVKTYSEMLRSWPVLQETIRQLGLPLSPDALAGRVTTKIIKDTQFLDVTVQDESPERTAAIANRLAEVFIARNRELQAGVGQDARRQVDQELADTRARIDDATRRLNGLKADPAAGSDAAGEIVRVQGELAQYQQLYYQLLEIQQRMTLEQARGASSIAIVEPARAPGARVGPGLRQNALVAALAGLLLSVGLAAAIEFLDDRVRDPDELRDRLGLTPLTILGRHRGGVGRVLSAAELTGKNPYAEALRLLRTNLDFLMPRGPRVVAVSSAVEGEGKSTVAANLAVTEAQAGKRVVLIDADLRRPSIHRFFDLPNAHGLSTYLAHARASTRPALQAGPLGLRILTSGPIPPNPSELLGSASMAALLDRLRAEADVIILDCVPILPVADTLVLQRQIDGIVLVHDVGHTGMKTLARAVERLRQVSANILGVVLNRDRRRTGPSYYGYDHKSGRVARHLAQAPATALPAPRPPAD